MPDPIWLDSNILIRLLDGDYVLTLELRGIQSQGRTLLVVPAVRHEVLFGNPLTMKRDKPVWGQVPSPQTRATAEATMKKLGIEVDMEAEKLGNGLKINVAQERNGVKYNFGPIDLGQQRRVGYAMQDHVKRPRNLAVPNSLDNISESDSLVLSQIKAGAEARGVAKPQFFTAEKPNKAMVSQAHVYGIDPIRPKTPPPGSGGGGSAPVPTIELAEYPADSEGAISRFFRDRPVLTQLGLVGVNMLATQVGPMALEKIKSHYHNAINDARREFESKCPDPYLLKNAARLDDYRLAYESALLKMQLPTAAKTFGAVLIVLTKEKDRDAMWKRIQDNLSQVRLPNGSMAGYNDAATAYLDAMVNLYGKYYAAWTSSGLADAAENVQKRASVLENAASSLNDMFWKVISLAAVSPVSYYAWLDVHTVADTIESLSVDLASFAGELRDRYAAYKLLSDRLDQQLIKVSEELNRYGA